MQVFVDLSNRILRRFECYFFILLMLTAASSVAQSVPVYEALSVSSLNRFQDNVVAIAVGGHYAKSFALGKDTVKKAGDKFRETVPAVGGYYWMLVAKSPLLPGATAGKLKVSRVDKWYNNKPAIKGLNYAVSGEMNSKLFKRVKLGDLLRWVPNANPDKSWYWKLNSELTDKEKLLVSPYSEANGVTVNDLPHLREGSIKTLGPATDLFNCYAYAVNRNDPAAIGWVAGKEGFPAGAKTHVVINSYDDFINFYRDQGWGVVAEGPAMPPVPASGLIAVYQDSNGYLKHAALVTPTGVFAKMGRLGTFKFSSLQQMSGSGTANALGTPNLWFGRLP